MNRSTGQNANSGSFQPGKTGNPGGRPADGEVAVIARRYTPDAIRALVDVMRNAKEQPGARVSAAVALLDRGWGKPRQDVSVSGDMGDALHLHFYAVQQLNNLAPDAAPAPAIEGTLAAEDTEPASQFADNLLPPVEDDWPEEALPLWDAARALEAKTPPDEEKHPDAGPAEGLGGDGAGSAGGRPVQPPDSPGEALT